MPSDGGPVAAASAIFLGDVDVLCDVLGFLEGLAVESPELLAPPASTSGSQISHSNLTTLPISLGIQKHRDAPVLQTARYQSDGLSPTPGPHGGETPVDAASEPKGPIWSSSTPLRSAICKSALHHGCEDSYD
eukprot:scaffold282587_cov41-Prasinocladus_malaysianus.AAC.1